MSLEHSLLFTAEDSERGRLYEAVEKIKNYLKESTVADDDSVRVESIELNSTQSLINLVPAYIASHRNNESESIKNLQACYGVLRERLQEAEKQITLN